MMTTPTPVPDRPPLALVTGAASGIGYQLARGCAEHGYDLLVAADTPDIEDAAQALRELGGSVEGVLADPCSPRGMEQLHRLAAARPIDALLVHVAAAAGQQPAEGHEEDARAVIDAQIAGVLALLHRLGGAIRPDGRGCVLVTGSLPGFVPAFVESFSLGLSSRIGMGGARVICVVPAAAQDGPVVRTEGLHTRVVHAGRNDPTAVASVALQAMLQGEHAEVAAASPATVPAGRATVPSSVLARVLRPAGGWAGAEGRG